MNNTNVGLWPLQGTAFSDAPVAVFDSEKLLFPPTCQFFRPFARDSFTLFTGGNNCQNELEGGNNGKYFISPSPLQIPSFSQKSWPWCVELFGTIVYVRAGTRGIEQG